MRDCAVPPTINCPALDEDAHECEAPIEIAVEYEGPDASVGYFTGAWSRCGRSLVCAAGHDLTNDTTAQRAADREVASLPVHGAYA